MQLCRVRKSFSYMECTYKGKYCTWNTRNVEDEPWESDTKLKDEDLVPIPAHFSIPSVS